MSVQPHGNRRHGMSESPEYWIWIGIKSRAKKDSYKQFKDYGGRGIRVCERWEKFDNFIADMGPRPSSHHSIDRINNDGDYEPGNCRWATRKEQSLNKRNTVFVSHGSSVVPLRSLFSTDREYRRAFYRLRSRNWSNESIIEFARQNGGLI